MAKNKKNNKKISKWGVQERFRQAYTLTKDFAQEQRLDQVELCVWGVWEGVADRRVMIQLKQWEREIIY